MTHSITPLTPKGVTRRADFPFRGLRGERRNCLFIINLTLDADYYLQLMHKIERTPEESRSLKSLYIKILNYNSWHKVVRMFDYDTLKSEIVVDEVIQGLFPRPLRKKYQYVKQLL